MDSALAYRAQEARSQSLPPENKSPVEMLTGAGQEQQNVSSLYLATESAPASPFVSLQAAVSVHARNSDPLLACRRCELSCCA